jgi:transposase
LPNLQENDYIVSDCFFYPQFYRAFIYSQVTSCGDHAIKNSCPKVKMGRASDLTVMEKSKIVTLRQEGASLRKISLVLGRSVNAVKQAINRFNETECIEKRERKTSCKPKISDATARYLKLLSKRDRRKTLPLLTQEVNSAISTPVSMSTVRRSLQSFDMNGRVACKKPLLRKANIRKRLKFAQEHVNLTVEQWNRVLFTDETKVEVFGTHRRTFVRRKPGERYKKECLVPTVKFGGGSVMCWGAICAKGALPLHRIVGIMTKQTYHQILIRQVKKKFSFVLLARMTVKFYTRQCQEVFGYSEKDLSIKKTMILNIRHIFVEDI